MSAGQESAEVKAAGAVSRDIRAATESVRAADRRAAHTSAAVRAVARQAVSARVEHRAADGRAAVKVEGVRVVRQAADVRVVRLVAARVEGSAGSSSKELP